MTPKAAGCGVPLVADIHFKPDAALEAAKWVEKVRVNPGNYADKKKFEVREYSDAEYDEELARICSDQSELYREMGWAGPLHGSNWWKLIQLLRNVRETCAHSNTSQHTLILALAPTISSHRVRSTPLRTFIGIWRGLPSGSRSAKPLRRRAAY